MKIGHYIRSTWHKVALLASDFLFASQQGIWIKVKAIRFQGKNVDVAGSIVKINAHNPFHVGEKVYGTYPNKMRFLNTSLSLLRMPCLKIWHAPDNLSPTQAAGIVTSGSQCIETVCEIIKANSSSRILFFAQNDPFARMCMELLKSIGAQVTVVTHERNFKRMRKLQADLIVNAAFEINHSLHKEYDAIIDSLGGKLLEDYLVTLKKKGKIILKENTTDTSFISPSHHVYYLQKHPTQRRLRILAFLLEEEIIHCPSLPKKDFDKSVKANLGISSLSNDDIVYEKD